MPTTCSRRVGQWLQVAVLGCFSDPAGESTYSLSFVAFGAAEKSSIDFYVFAFPNRGGHILSSCALFGSVGLILDWIPDLETSGEAHPGL
jgi:hypothetical protein